MAKVQALFDSEERGGAGLLRAVELSDHVVDVVVGVVVHFLSHPVSTGECAG